MRLLIVAFDDADTERIGSKQYLSGERPRHCDGG